MKAAFGCCIAAVGAPLLLIVLVVASAGSGSGGVFAAEGGAPTKLAKTDDARTCNTSRH